MRLTALKADPSLRHTGSSSAYLAALVPRLRAMFAGPLTYASLTFEQVDWRLFDYVGVDHYREARTKDRYVEMLQPFLATGKPVIVTEFGMRTFRGAESSGALGFGVTDTTRLVAPYATADRAVLPAPAEGDVPARRSDAGS